MPKWSAVHWTALGFPWATVVGEVNHRRKSLDELVAETRAAIAAGGMSEADMAEMEAQCRAAEEIPQEERAGYDHFLRHMPPDDSNLTMIVLKGHLLIEQRLREFIDERLLSPAALTAAELNTHQTICLAEALTLPSEAASELWAIVRKINKLRNVLAHNMDPAGVQDRVKHITDTYGARWPVQFGFVGVLGHCYSQITELCRLARSMEFRVRGKT